MLLALGLIAELFTAIRLGVGLSTTAAPGFEETVNKGGNVRSLARLLFNGYFFPFEATSILLIVAAVAAMVIAGRRSSLRGEQTSEAVVAETPPLEPAEPEPEREPVG